MSQVSVTAVVVANLIGMMILLIVRYCTNSILENYREKDIRTVQIAVALNLAGFFTDMLMYSLDSSRGEIVRIIILLCRTYSSFANIWISVLWIGFLKYHLYGEKKEINTQMKLLCVMGVVIDALLVVNFFFPFLFKVDENNHYTRLLPGYGLVLVVLILMAYSIIHYYDYRRTKGLVRFFPIGVFLIPVAIGHPIQMMIYGLSLGWVSMAISLSGILMSLQSEAAYVDNVTGLVNRAFLFNNKSYRKVSGVIMLDLDRFRYINSVFGHREGDNALRDFGKIVQRVALRYGFAVRYTGDEFLLFSRIGKEQLLEQIVEELRKELDQIEVGVNRPYELSFSYGLKVYDPDTESFDDIEKVLEERLNKNKALFYERHPELDRRRKKKETAEESE